MHVLKFLELDEYSVNPFHDGNESAWHKFQKFQENLKFIPVVSFLAIVVLRSVFGSIFPPADYLRTFVYSLYYSLSE